MTKILLFETSTEEQNRLGGKVSEVNDTPYPVGILYLDAILKKKGYEVRTTDYTQWTEENCLRAIRKELEQFKPDIVGISVMTMTRVSAYKAIKMIKLLYPKIKIVLGGMHSSMMYEQLLKNFPIEAICIGEAEESFPELIEAMTKKKNKKSIKGIAYIQNGKLIVTERRKLMTNLDDLPFPSYDVFMNPNINIVRIISSRGCPNKCSYCCLHITGRQMWRTRSVNNVVDEIEFIAKRYPWIETIQFLDDTFTLDNKRVISICKEIIKRKIRLKFTCQGRIKPISREMIYWMEKAGFIQIIFGIETGSRKLLVSIHKNITPEDCFETFNILRKFKKIKPEILLMVGFPGEDENTVRETINLSKRLHKMIRMSFFYVNPLWIYPGTEVYQLLKDRGVMDDSYWLSDKPCPVFTLEHDEKWLIKMANRIAFQSVLAQGIVYFAVKLVKNVAFNPKHYLDRFLNKTILKGIK